MISLSRNRIEIVFVTAVLLWLMFCASFALAEDAPKIPCPTSEPCKVLFLSPQEERMLMGQNGILDTAAQARNLDLGQFSVYLKTQIAAAPSGEVKPAPNNSQPATDPTTVNKP